MQCIQKDYGVLTLHWWSKTQMELWEEVNFVSQVANIMWLNNKFLSSVVHILAIIR